MGANSYFGNANKDEMDWTDVWFCWRKCDYFMLEKPIDFYSSQIRAVPGKTLMMVGI
jgi:hypothetical protein